MDFELLDITHLQSKYQRFGAWDYVAFGSMIIVCSSIGLYFGFKKRKTEDTAMEYLLGGRRMSLIPISMSLIASWVSGVAILGNPTEVYFYGTKYMFITLGLIPASLIATYVFLPVFYEMQVSSTYEYLERRFDKKVRLYGATAFTIYMIGYLPIVTYVPALAFNQVTGIDVRITSTCVCSVCIFYTTIGGLKAVVWTDVIQMLIMFGSVILVVMKGIIEIGGFEVVWKRNQEGERIEIPNFDMYFTDRYSIWSLTIGAAAFWLQVAFMNQNMIQRYMALPTLKNMKRAVLCFTIGTICLFLLTCVPGLVVYATYYDCDPLATKLISAKDQLLPLFVMEILRDYPGMPGLFVAGVFSASLSTLSTGLNAMSAVVLQDFMSIWIQKKTLSSQTTNTIMRSVVILFGVLYLGLVFVVEKVGTTIMQLAISMAAITNGPIFGLFCGGMLLPWMNANGAFYGALLGLAASGFVVLGSQNAIATGQIQFPTKALSVDGCDYFHNVTVTNGNYTESDVFPLYKMSYLWHTLFSGIFTLITGMILSYLTGLNDPSNIDPKCLSPVIRRYLVTKKIPEGEVLLKTNDSKSQKDVDQNS